MPGSKVTNPQWQDIGTLAVAFRDIGADGSFSFYGRFSRKQDDDRAGLPAAKR